MIGASHCDIQQRFEKKKMNNKIKINDLKRQNVNDAVCLDLYFRHNNKYSFSRLSVKDGKSCFVYR